MAKDILAGIFDDKNSKERDILEGYTGNIDLKKRPIIYNKDGSFSTEKSFSFRDEKTGKEILIPKIVNGKEVSYKEAIDHYYKTGKNLGVFDTPEEANKMAKKIHNRFSGKPRDILEGVFDNDKSKPRDILADYHGYIQEQDNSLSARFSRSIRNWIMSNEMSFPPIQMAKAVLFGRPETEKDKVVQQLLGTSLNIGLANYPYMVARKVGAEQAIPQAETPLQQIAHGVGYLGGFVGGLPMKAGRLAGAFIPIIPTSKPVLAFAQTLLRDGIQLGAAEASLAPDRELLGIPQRTRAFGSGFVTGVAFGGLGFIPNKPLRMILTSLYSGQPWSRESREQPLETQIFNYGLGAYWGIKGHKLSDLVKQGAEVESKIYELSKKQNAELLNEVKQEAIQIREGKENIYKKDIPQLIRHMVGGGKYYYNPPVNEKVWRKNTIKEVLDKWKALRKDPKYHLRKEFLQGDYLYELDERLRRKKDGKLKKNLSGKDLEKLSNSDLYNLREYFKHPANNPKTPFRSELPVKKEFEGKKLTLWQRMTTGYGQLKRLGFGKLEDTKSLMHELLLDASAEQSRFLARHIALTNNWKRMVGLSPKVAKKIFRYLDGKLSKKELTDKELGVAKEIRQYYDSLLDLINEYRISKGLKPIERRSNYITHTFEPLFREMIAGRHPFPDIIEANFKYMTPKEKSSPFLKERTSNTRIGLIEDVWRALDTYAYSTAGVITDTPIRKVDGLLRFIDAKMRVEKKKVDAGGKPSKVDWAGLKKNIEAFIKGYANRRAEWETEQENTVEALTKHLPKEWQINLGNAMNVLRGVLYFNTMAFRPKLAIRNLAQHSLIIGETGLKYLNEALKKRFTPESQKALEQSKVLATRRAGHFAPEIAESLGERVGGKLLRGGMYLYRKADLINVQDAFLAGYYKARAEGKSIPKAIAYGDSVAARTQFLYTAGNRSQMAMNLWGKSRAMGKMASVFTTWPVNYTELMLDWINASGKPRFSKQLARYLALNAVLLSTLGLAGVDIFKYTGLNSIPAMLKMATGQLPISGVSTSMNLFKPNTWLPLFMKDLLKLDKDLADYLIYMWR